MKLSTSRKNIISIRYFMENYLCIKYKKNDKLTHKLMQEFLLEKNVSIPKKAIFGNINNEDILTGKVLIVRDEVGQKIAYRNPMIALSALQAQLESADKEELKKIREKLILEQLEQANQKSYEKVKRR